MTTSEALKLIDEGHKKSATQPQLLPLIAALKQSRGAILKYEQALNQKKKQAFEYQVLLLVGCFFLISFFLGNHRIDLLFYWFLVWTLFSWVTSAARRQALGKKVEKREAQLKASLSQARSLMERDGVELKKALGHYPPPPTKPPWFRLKK